MNSLKFSAEQFGMKQISLLYMAVALNCNILLNSCGGSSPATPALVVYVSSFGDNSIKLYDGATGAFKGNLVAPSGNGLSGPHNLAFGSDVNVYVAGGLSNDVKRFNSKTGAFIDVFIS